MPKFQWPHCWINKYISIKCWYIYRLPKKIATIYLAYQSAVKENDPTFSPKFFGTQVDYFILFS